MRRLDNESMIRWRATLSGASQRVGRPLTWLGRAAAEAPLLLSAAEEPAKCTRGVRSCTSKKSTIKCLHTCGTGCRWRPACMLPLIPLSCDKAEALSVMMWLLLPIMPRCRAGCKTARFILARRAVERLAGDGAHAALYGAFPERPDTFPMLSGAHSE